MSITAVEISESLTFLKIEGSMNHAAVQKMESDFLTLTAGRKKPVILDLSAVDFIASMGMRLLIEAAKDLAHEDAKIAVFGTRPAIAKVLEAAGMGHVLTLAGDEAAARAAVAG